MIKNLQAHLSALPPQESAHWCEVAAHELDDEIRSLQRQLHDAHRDSKAIADQVDVLKSERDSMQQEWERMRRVAQEFRQAQLSAEMLEMENALLAKQLVASCPASSALEDARCRRRVLSAQLGRAEALPATALALVRRILCKLRVGCQCEQDAIRGA